MMNTYTIKLVNGQDIVLLAEDMDMSDPSTITLVLGNDSYHFFRESILYWSVSPGALEELTDRQLEILRLMSRGKTNASISRGLGFSESTVRTESMAIYRNLHVHSRGEAVAEAAARGIIEPCDASVPA